MNKIKSEKGMMTVEVVLCLTIYVAFFVILLNVLNVMYLRQKFQAALKPIAIQISREYEVRKELERLEAKDATQKFVKLEDRNRMYTRSYDYAPTQSLMSNGIENFFLNVADINGYIVSDLYLEDMNIVGGISGLDFSSSTINEGGNGMVDLTLKYRVRIVNLPFFNGAGLDVNVEQHACTSLWR